jgi:hypothetical protein
VPTEVWQNLELHTRVDRSYRRCWLCHQRTWVKCQQCQVGLHMHYWYEFHTQKWDTHEHKASTVNHTKDVIMQIINLSNQQMCFYVSCSYIISIIQQNLDHSLSTLPIPRVTCGWHPSTTHTTWTFFYKKTFCIHKHWSHTQQITQKYWKANISLTMEIGGI